MPERRTPRQLAREETLRRINELALAQLAHGGAAELSLRAIARELHLVSSAIYRYYPSRDELVTDLIIDAYDDLAGRLAEAGRPDRRRHRRRWTDVCGAFRGWANDQPHRFALIYGSSIPDYRAPGDTVEPAARVVRAFAAPVETAVREGRVRRPTGLVGQRLRRQLNASAEALGLDLPVVEMLAVVGAFARVVGLLTLEQGGHFVGGFEPADAVFGTLVEREADALGL
jgi:AcrR family transcriptional regulator